MAVETPSDVEAPFSKPPVSFRDRLRIGLGALAGLRGADFVTAARFVKTKYAGRPFVVQWTCFAGWALKQVFVEIPSARQCLRIGARVSRTPLWLSDGNPLANYPWGDKPEVRLPREVDTLVIGAGFTGGALAYHWARRAPVDRRIAVVEMGDPASGSSGRNEGLVVMGRYFKMVHDSVLNHLGVVRRELPTTDRSQLAWQFADRYCHAAYRNAELIEQTIWREGFDCEYARAGWVQAREEEDQAGLRESVKLARQSGFSDWTELTPEEVRARTGMHVQHNAGFSVAAASWHPAKWVWSLLTRALAAPTVELFTRTKVLRIDRSEIGFDVHTDRGTIHSRNIVYATESYTPKLDQRLHGAILPIQEQAACGVGGPETMPPHVGISGSWFFAGRYGDRVMFGSGGPLLRDDQAGANRPSRFLTNFVATELLRLYGRYRLQLTNEWSGTTGYTPDEYPIVGELDSREYIIGGMCGSGSGVSFNAGRCIVNRILGLTDEPDDYPESYFSPSRLLAPDLHAWPVVVEEIRQVNQGEAQ